MAISAACAHHCTLQAVGCSTVVAARVGGGLRSAREHGERPAGGVFQLIVGHGRGGDRVRRRGPAG